MAVLNSDNPPRVERAAIADPVNFVNDWHSGIARAHEISVQGMHMPVRCRRALSGDESLRDHLPAKHPLPAHLRAATTKQIVFQLLKVEYGNQFLHGTGHGRLIN